MEELRDIAHFVEVARTRNFVRAAERLQLPASTLSRRISELERSLGMKLLNRTTRRVELTEAGQIFLVRCQTIVDEALAAREDLRNHAHSPRGLLRVSMSPDFGTVYLAPLIAEFSRMYPEISMQLDLSPRRVDLISENFDMAIRVGAPDEPYLFARRIALAKRGLYASPGFLKQNIAPKAPADLAGLSCLSVDHPNSGDVWLLRRGHTAQEIEIAGRVKANNPRMVLHLAVEGVGIAVIDDVMAAPFVKTGALKRILREWETTPVPIYAVTSTKTPPLKVKSFIEHLQKNLKSRSS
jgi:DNA-binding transcriptional LysR family regulator